MLMTLGTAHELLQGYGQRVGDAMLPLQRVHSDTRTLKPGDLYVALRGERFDGHDFMAQARSAGAVAALAESGLGAGMPGLLVPDSLQGLQRLAAAWRRSLNLQLVAVTGSNGKTTVTQMVAAILQAWLGGASLATAGNLNNHIGVPLTLLRLRQGGQIWHRAAVLELGMNHPGEIRLLADMAAPTVALINNAQREHQEFMASVDAVAQENGSVINALPADGTAVLPFADAYLPMWRGMAGTRRVLSFGMDARADVSGRAAWMAESSGAPGHWQLTLQTGTDTISTTVQLPGQHNLHNAMAAAAAALAAGAPPSAVSRGLTAFRPVAGRSQAITLQRDGQPLTLVDDSYNANPDSVLAAIDVLASLPGPRWLVLGDMGEVGTQGPQFHAEVGARARDRGIDVVWAAGALSAHAGATRWFENTASVVDALAQAPQARSVLVKGSRFMKMEHVVQALRKRWGLPHAA